MTEIYVIHFGRTLESVQVTPGGTRCPKPLPYPPPPPLYKLLISGYNSTVCSLRAPLSLCLGTQPFAVWLDLLPRDGAKFPESVWKLFFYTVAWFYTCYLLFNGNYNFFHDPQSVFHDWHSGMPVPLDIYAAYLFQGSFYLHSVYGTMYMDTWRRDSPMMLLHHGVTVLLVSFSYAFRYHNVGIVVFFLHDITDILLEFSKINIYLKQHDGQYQHIYKFLADVSSAGFGVTWFVFRLYWFPLKVLYATSVSSLKSHPDIPFYFFFNVLLLAITAMNLNWFWLIIMFAFKIMTGQLAEVADTREYDISTQTQQESLIRSATSIPCMKFYFLFTDIQILKGWRSAL
uniref:Ceramide synthase 1 n=1 Tax=Eptatretus burgeri TaxID=7764 RepID=A0A8C4NAG6_EPTBU